MRRVLVVVFVGLLIASAAFGAEIKWTEYSAPFSAGDIAIQAGLGLLYGMAGNTVIPPIGVSVDWAMPVSELPFSFGAYVGFAHSKDEYSMVGYDWSYTYTYVLFGARAAYHVNFGGEKLDPYGGLLLGYNYASVKTEGTAITGAAVDAGGLLLGGYLGARYFFNPRFAVYGELGYGVGVLNIGATYKL
jgi:hypothetical protein